MDCGEPRKGRERMGIENFEENGSNERERIFCSNYFDFIEWSGQLSGPNPKCALFLSLCGLIIERVSPIVEGVGPVVGGVGPTKGVGAVEDGGGREEPMSGGVLTLENGIVEGTLIMYFAFRAFFTVLPLSGHEGSCPDITVI
ncbi:hypothetical protein V8G54_001095 [Vigna mungo]|uniref:Uncharacterized protein n=1 Tax=Vigna mungo TaxID=3915 RepID=A0AAQ3P7N8_VIGMU